MRYTPQLNERFISPEYGFFQFDNKERVFHYLIVNTEGIRTTKKKYILEPYVNHEKSALTR